MRTDNAIDQSSRTLLVEVDVDNADGKLLPGAYAFVHFALPSARSAASPSPPTRCSSAAKGLRVGVVRDGKVELVPIKIGRDYGDQRRGPLGASSTDQVILNPSDSLASGTTVHVNASKPSEPANAARLGLSHCSGCC